MDWKPEKEEEGKTNTDMEENGREGFDSGWQRKVQR